MVICRQRPGTAKGFVFLSLEDESGIANVVVAPALFEAQRLLLMHEPFLRVDGVLQIQRGVIHVRANQIWSLQADALSSTGSHDFH